MPVVNTEASTCRKKGLERFGCCRDGLARIILMIISSAAWQSEVHTNRWSFFVSATRGQAMFV